MKTVLVSDTHEQEDQIRLPEGELLIHAGDLTDRGSIVAVIKCAKWMGAQDFKHKVVIMGNHEVGGEFLKNKEMRRIFADHGLIYLEDSGCEIEGLKLWGSPVSPRFFDWEWNRDRGADIKRHWDLIPTDIDVLITHSPPYGILDNTPHGDKIGCKDLLDRIKQLPNLKLSVFGHLHHRGSEHLEQDGVLFVNAAICTEAYAPTNLPIEVEITKEKAFAYKRMLDYTTIDGQRAERVEKEEAKTDGPPPTRMSFAMHKQPPPTDGNGLSDRPQFTKQDQGINPLRRDETEEEEKPENDD